MQINDRKIKSLFIGLTLCLAVFLYINSGVANGSTKRRFQHGAILHQRQSENVVISAMQTSPIIRQKLTDGYDLASRMLKRYHGNTTAWKPLQRVNVFSVFKSNSTNLQFCAIWKIASTLIKRLFWVHLHRNNITNPYDISYDKPIHPNAKYIFNTRHGMIAMMARDPYSRLHSAYVDKLLAPNPVYWNIISVPAIKLVRSNSSTLSRKCGHDLTFKEFIQYVKLTMTSNKLKPDPHFQTMTKLCKPELVNYSFVGKIEHSSKDLMEVINKLNMVETGSILKADGRELAAIDAIEDTVHQPFDPEFRKAFVKCISVKEALERAWKKLQIRGLIGNTPLNITEEAANTLSHSEFIDMALKARQISSSDERKSLKKRSFKDMYSTLAPDQLNSLANIYAPDFEAFEYDPRPPCIFDNISSTS